jgi:hypothetical protein
VRVSDDRPYQMPPREVYPGKPWPAGPWDEEPDFEGWVEPETGYRCAAMRNPMGNWCGYVQVAPDSLLAGMDKDDRVELPPGWRDKRMTLDDVGVLNVFCEAFGEKQPGLPIGMLVAVHGGINYCKDDWWGFDCGHAGDEIPGLLAICSRQYREFFKDKLQYRTLPYVRHECTQLAWQLKELSDALAAVATEKLAGIAP